MITVWRVEDVILRDQKKIENGVFQAERGVGWGKDESLNVSDLTVDMIHRNGQRRYRHRAFLLATPSHDELPGATDMWH